MNPMYIFRTKMLYGSGRGWKMMQMSKKIRKEQEQPHDGKKD